MPDQNTTQVTWLKAQNLGAIHGFSTRQKRAGQGMFDGNLSSRVGDDASYVSKNRQVALGELGQNFKNIALLNQIHSERVLCAPFLEQMPEADASVSNDPETLLVIETADCYPILFEDKEAGVVGAAHAGWRGTVAKIANKTITAMRELGAETKRIRVAIGPGICAKHYWVGEGVRQEFLDAGFHENLFQVSTHTFETPGKSEPTWHLDLAKANAEVLESVGILRQNIWQAQRCSNEAEFFSYRRDAAKTGRMWAVIAATWPQGKT